MSAISRRAAMLAVPAAAAGSVAVSMPVAQASPGEQVITFTTKRSKNTLPLNPPLGAPFIIYLSLYDTSNTMVGDGSVFGMVVDVIVAVPPEIVVQVKTIFRATGRRNPLQWHANPQDPRPRHQASARDRRRYRDLPFRERRRDP